MSQRQFHPAAQPGFNRLKNGGEYRLVMSWAKAEMHRSAADGAG